MDPNDSRKKIEEANKERAAQEREVDNKVRLFQRAYDSFPDEASKNLLKGGAASQVHQLLEENNFKNPEEILEARSYWSNYKESPAEERLNMPKEEAPINTSRKSPPGSTVAMLGVVGAGAVYDRLKDRKYNKFKKEADKYAKEKTEEWKINPDPEFAKSEKGAYNHAYNDFHDKFLAESPKNATKWAKQHKDEALQNAIKKKEILDKPNPKRDWRETERYINKAGIKHPEKTHKIEGGMSREESDKRIAAAATMGATQATTPAARQVQASQTLEVAREEGAKQNATPESAADSLQANAVKVDGDTGQSEFEKRINAAKQNAKPDDFENRTLVAKEEGEKVRASAPEDAVKKIEEQIEVERKRQDDEKDLVLPKTQKFTHQQPPLRKTITTPSQRRTSVGRTTYPFRRSARARRRYGGIGGRVGRKYATRGVKRGVARAGSLIFTNPVVLIIIGIAIAFIIGIFVAIALIQDVCNKYADPFVAAQNTISDPGGMLLRAPIWGILAATNSCPNRPYDIVVPKNPPGIITIIESEDIAVDNGETITYTITVIYDPNVASIPLEKLYLFSVPKFPYGVESITGINNPRLEGSDGATYARWGLAENEYDSTLDGVFEFRFELELKPLAEDIRAINVVYVSEEYVPVELSYNSNPDAGATTPINCDPNDPNALMCGANSLPTDDVCGGKYTGRLKDIYDFLYSIDNKDPRTSPNPYTKMAGTGYNFADPVCSYTPAKWRALLRQTEKNQKKWEFWEDIANCESGILGIGEKDIRRVTYSKNGVTYNFPFGPWGHFQTGRGRPPIAKAANRNDEDRGDVTWQQQIINAVKLNNDDAQDGRNYQYWGTAYCFCAYPYYAKENAWCGDIISNGWVRTNCGNQCIEDTVASKN